ncbi:MAG: hypothetical protein CMF25_08270 [Kangiellaceae bacterium]|nr:hypothetical protein [Kangiellaceae bacterium]|tara:strand:- start:9516 stop:9875 length:360 start_codon:yes stop_codon:yes gene_type:complete
MPAFKQLVASICLASTLLVPTVAFSHADGHGHQAAPPTTEQVIDTASQYITQLIEKGEMVEGAPLNASWNNVAEKKIYKKTLRNYIVSFKAKESDKILYILMDNRGYFRGANYSGNFEQ